jgi:hypothetical protein
VTDPPFNPANIDALVRNLPNPSLAVSLVEAASSASEIAPAARVANLLERRVKEVRAELNGPHVA